MLGQRVKISPSITYLMVLLAGQMLNTIFPARLGDLARAYVLGGMGPGRTYVLGTIVLEKMLDSIAYITPVWNHHLVDPPAQLDRWFDYGIYIGTVDHHGGILLLIFWPAPFHPIL